MSHCRATARHLCCSFLAKRVSATQRIRIRKEISPWPRRPRSEQATVDSSTAVARSTEEGERGLAFSLARVYDIPNRYLPGIEGCLVQLHRNSLCRSYVSAPWSCGWPDYGQPRSKRSCRLTIGPRQFAGGSGNPSLSVRRATRFSSLPQTTNRVASQRSWEYRRGMFSVSFKKPEVVFPSGRADRPLNYSTCSSRIRMRTLGSVLLILLHSAGLCCRDVSKKWIQIRLSDSR